MRPETPAPLGVSAVFFQWCEPPCPPMLPQFFPVARASVPADVAAVLPVVRASVPADDASVVTSGAGLRARR